ncbi:MAG: glycerophosphodiester phosphodiesterase [Burkholderiales bacterium]|nr:glycerophosphodiester phosphodiesterase [Burkholderiales bacterium]
MKTRTDHDGDMPAEVAFSRGTGGRFLDAGAAAARRMRAAPLAAWLRRLWLLVAVCYALPAVALDLQGHRGARGLAPENTMPAFEAGIRQGVSTLELDVAVTRDGVVVIHHDLRLNPFTTRDEQGRWLEQPGPAIAQLSWDELQRYDVGRLKPGSKYARQFPDQVAVDGTRVPRLSDLFERVLSKGPATLRFAIEIKTDPRDPGATRPPEEIAALVVDEIRRAGLLQRVQILSFDWRGLQAVQRLAPELPTVYLSVQQRGMDNIEADVMKASPWVAGFAYREHGSVPRMIKAARGRIWSVHFRDLDERKLEEAHALGLKVLVWTVNDPAQMARLIDMGVDGLVTDRPDLARPVLEARGRQPK